MERRLVFGLPTLLMHTPAQPIPCTAQSLSTEEISRDVTRQLTAITELIRPAELGSSDYLGGFRNA